MKKIILPVVALCAFLTMPLQAGSIVAGKPEELGFSAERLSRIHDAVQRHIDAKSLAGAVTMVVRNGRIAHLEAHGLIDIEANRPMPKDGIFRLASTSKPVTAVAVMMLHDEGKLKPTDLVSKYIPEFADLKTPSGKPANLTITHLLTHTSGLAEASGEDARKAKTLKELVPFWLAKPTSTSPFRE